MAKTEVNEQLLRDYLLGRIDSESQRQLEEIYFSEDEVFGQLLIVYDDLADKYVNGELTEDESRIFQQRYLASGKAIQEFSFEKAIREKISKEQELSGHKQKESLISMLKGIWLKFLEPIPKPVLQLVPVAATIVLFIIVNPFGVLGPPAFDHTSVGEVQFVYQTDERGTVGGPMKLRSLTAAPPAPDDTGLVLKALDRYALQIKPESGIFLYLFQWDMADNMTVIFPNLEIVNFGNPLEADRQYRFPPTSMWFTLDETPGMETIGLGVSGRRWEKMEAAIGLFDKGDENEKRTAMILIKSLIQEVEKESEGMYYGRRFSFHHAPRGGEK